MAIFYIATVCHAKLQKRARGKNLCGVMFNNHFYPVTSAFVHHSSRHRVEKLLAFNPNSESFGTSVYDPVRKCKFPRKRETDDDEITRKTEETENKHENLFGQNDKQCR